MKRFVGDEGYVVDLNEIVVPSEDEDEGEEPRRGARQRRPVRRFIEEY